MDRGKCKAPKATATLCASVMASGAAPVLVSAFGASADTSRRQEMQIGDALLVFGFGFVGIPIIGMVTVLVDTFMGLI